MAKSLSKLIKPGDGRKSRLHDAQNHRVSIFRLIRNGRRAVATALLVKFANKRPTQPWISCDAIEMLELLLTSSSRVLEYGSGMSTVWYASHSQSVISVEDDASWAEFQRRSFAERRIDNAELVVATERDEYVSAGGRAAPASGDKFDLIMIDGRFRDACAERALELVAPGGSVYLDNSDVTRFNELDGDVGRDKRLLVDAAEKSGGKAIDFVDLSPGCLHPTGGTRVRL